MKKNMPVLIFAILCSFVLKAQTVDRDLDKLVIKEPETKKTNNLIDPGEKIFSAVEKMPDFPGGFGNLNRFFSQNFHFPVNVKPQKIDGLIFLDFVVERNGSLNNVKFNKNLTGHSAIGNVSDEIIAEAVRVLSISPDWIPGTQNGYPARVIRSMPIKFPIVISEDSIYHVVDKQPEFPGGASAFNAFLSKNLQYPPDAWEKNIQGKVYLQFVVEKDGQVLFAKVIRHLANDIDNEALRVIYTSPNWKPAEQNGEPVSVTYIMPITFRKPSPVKQDTVPTILPVETPPEYPGGVDALMKFVQQNLHIGNEQGKVITGFIVEKDGSLTDIRILKSLSEKADAEALRVIGKMPKWKPGIQGGNAVRVAYTIPIYFSTN